ncbi:hypothetical protein Tco_1573971 [Tanacetum coccineum]
MCFEKAGDKIWENKAKAFGLKKLAYQLKGATTLKEAADMFKLIGEDECAAPCYREESKITSWLKREQIHKEERTARESLCTKGWRHLRFSCQIDLEGQVECLMYSIAACGYKVYLNEYPEYLELFKVIALETSNIVSELKQGPVYAKMLEDNPLEDVLHDIREKGPRVDKHWNDYNCIDI